MFADHREEFIAGRGMHIITLAGPDAPEPFTDAKRLAAEVLRQAFADLESSRPVIRELTEGWIHSDDEDEHSFLHVCDVLGFDTRNIRAAAADPARRRQINDTMRRLWNQGGHR